MTKGRILVVDDEKNIRITVAQALENVGYYLHTAYDGKDAMIQLEEDEYDLIITDLKMPGIDGMKLLKKATEMYPEIKIATIAAHGSVDNAVEAMKLGAIDFLQKPFTPREIRDLVHNILQEEEESEYESCLKAVKHLIARRKFESAIEKVKKAIGINPSKPDAFVLLGNLQEISGDRLEAVKNYRVAVDLDGTYKPAKDNLYRATSKTNKIPKMSNIR